MKYFWKIEEKGDDITPSGTYTPKPKENSPQVANQASGEVLEKMREWAKKMEDRVTLLELEVITLKSEIESNDLTKIEKAKEEITY